MDRKVVFTHKVDDGPCIFPRSKYASLRIDFWFEIYTVHLNWAILVDVIEEKWLPAKNPGSPRKASRTLFSTRIRGDQDSYILAKALDSCDHETSLLIAENLFMSHVIKPSVLQFPEDDPDNWFKIYAKKSWDLYSCLIIRSMEDKCSEVHDS